MPASVFRDVRTIMVVSVVNEQSDQNILQMFIFKGIPPGQWDSVLASSLPSTCLNQQ